MSYLDHIAACNDHDIGKFRPFEVEGRRLGWVRNDVAALLAARFDCFTVTPDRVILAADLKTPDQRAAAIDAVCRTLAEECGTPALRGERYAVAARWGATPAFTIDRAVVSLFGVRAYGVHVNGLVRGPDGLSLWIGRRAPDKKVAPNRLDNMVAGGQPAHLGLMDNLAKEAAEEADIPESLARTARPVGIVSYCVEDRWGLKPDTMFCYDLEVPEDFVPRNTDGEITEFRLMPVAEVARMVRNGDAFKYNVNLVLIDFLVRHGIVSPDEEPDYLAIAGGLRRGW
jgi:hypothetical protein